MNALPDLLERDFQAQVLDVAKLLGWRRAHFRPAKTSKGWRTAVSGDGAGFPDLILLRGPRLVVAELKTEKGRVRDDQKDWLKAWQTFADETSRHVDVALVEVHVWRPSMLDEITRVLR